MSDQRPVRARRAVSTFGWHCPADGGLLLHIEGRNELHCPNQAHDGLGPHHTGGPRPPTPHWFDEVELAKSQGAPRG